jgi:hypothetical protein
LQGLAEQQNDEQGIADGRARPVHRSDQDINFMQVKKLALAAL